jgi:hypothetical protein
MKRQLKLALLLVFVAGCPAEERPADPPGPPAVPDQTTEPGEVEMARCTNATVGYEIAFPAEWETNTGEVMPECSLFDPEPIRVEPATELPYDIAVSIREEPIAFETFTGEMRGRRELTRENTTVGGRRAARMESESTGEGLLPEGIRSYQYIVDLGGSVLLLSTHDIGYPPYHQTVRVLDDMARTLRLTGR